MLFSLMKNNNKHKKTKEGFELSNVCKYLPKKDLKKNKVKNIKCKYPQYTRLYNRPNKCFSCEKQMKRYGKHINIGFPGKCFSCEKQSKDPYNEGPTKCFSCENK